MHTYLTSTGSRQRSEIGSRKHVGRIKSGYQQPSKPTATISFSKLRKRLKGPKEVQEGSGPASASELMAYGRGNINFYRRGAAVGASLPLSSYRNRILVFLSATAVYTAFLYRSGVFRHNLLLGLDEDERGVERASFSGQYIIPMTLQNQISPHILFLQIRCLLQLTKF